MLNNTTPIQPKQIHQRQQRLAIHLQMHHPNIPIKRLMQDRPIQARDQIAQERDGGGTALRREGRVVYVVGTDVG